MPSPRLSLPHFRDEPMSDGVTISITELLTPVKHLPSKDVRTHAACLTEPFVSFCVWSHYSLPLALLVNFW